MKNTKKVIGVWPFPKGGFTADNNPSRGEAPFGKIGAHAASHMKATPPSGKTVSTRVQAALTRAKGLKPPKADPLLAEIRSHLAPSGRLRRKS